MTKEEKIKEAWGKYLPELEENGWLYFGYACNGWDDVEDCLNNFGAIFDRSYYDMTYTECDNGDLINVKIRPKSLQGIEDNNGWQKIESEADLPPNTKEANKAYKVLCKHIKFPDSLITAIWGCTEIHKKQWLKDFTHYKLIDEEIPPIF